jgi:hypothetical protein
MRATDLDQLMTQLAEERPVFHSEADFQHALAWTIRSTLPNCDIRLEKRLVANGETMHVDMCLEEEGSNCVAELKYKVRKLEVAVADEHFALADQGAQPLFRYDFVKDIRRLESIVAAGQYAAGWAIMLTNNCQYWNRPRKSDACDATFRIHDGAILGPGALAWREGTGEGTMRSREAAIPIDGSYDMRWRDYSDLRELGGSDSPAGEFRYLLVQVPAPPSASR